MNTGLMHSHTHRQAGVQKIDVTGGHGRIDEGMKEGQIGRQSEKQPGWALGLEVPQPGPFALHRFASSTCLPLILVLIRAAQSH